MIGLMVVFIALFLLIYLAYRGVSLLILTPALATFAVVASREGSALGSYTQIFMGGAGNFITLYFPIFLLGAVFGKLMEDSGSAQTLANGIIAKLGAGRAILAVVLSGAVMTYGGVSLFVVAFAVFPIAAALFRQANIPKRLIPATIALGAFTFTMTALPGTPSIQNAIPMPYFGTSPFAAPGLGVITALIMFGLGLMWLQYRARSLAAEGYGDHPDAEFSPNRELREKAAGEGFDLMELPVEQPAKDQPSFVVAVLPLITVIAVNLLFTFVVIPRMDTGFLALPLYGETDIEAVRGVWSVIVGLVCALLLLLAMNWRRLPGLKQTLDNGANASLVPIFNTASLVGFGAVIASLSAFLLIRDSVVTLGGDNPLISLAIAVNILAGMTGSASGGMSIALSTLGDTYLEMARVAGINPELLHRVTAVATGGLDTLPHNGAVITLLAIAGLTHRQAYFDLAMVAMLAPFISLIALITLGTLFGNF
ncbi:H+/gluconate symporter [Ectothiorhodosinus mongolicus]|uniref:H+/gluconate symporter n=1 Tax=Ectothiorhodosinus mongolicus TaxID=233100 RepID=A0A1R3VPR3_9GAMM|nr:GntP family permease [Ectothiorhodosinus mongolicus]ULX56405.1 transporter [Ectothiorhodosinus mongolicus]SIT65925.1 H+/gluconate symporter [Ectothiorhodosinus mongolicus]